MGSAPGTAGTVPAFGKGATAMPGTSDHQIADLCSFALWQMGDPAFQQAAR